MLRILVGYKSNKATKAEDPSPVFCGHCPVALKEATESAQASGKFGLLALYQNNIPRYIFTPKKVQGKTVKAAAKKSG